MSVAAVDAAVDAAGAGQRCVLENMAVHLCWLVQVAGGVVLYRDRGGDGEAGEDKGRNQPDLVYLNE